MSGSMFLKAILETITRGRGESLRHISINREEPILETRLIHLGDIKSAVGMERSINFGEIIIYGQTTDAGLMPYV